MTTTGERLPPLGRGWYRDAALIGLALVAVTLGHYYTSTRALGLHELFTRLYYLPILFAALRGGRRWSLVTAAVSTAVFLPHVVLEWHAWPAVQVGQYAESVMFFLVAGVGGVAAERLQQERDGVARVNGDLARALAQLEASLDERLRVDRLVAAGHLATGLAHELRNPLAVVSGAIDILDRGTASPSQRAEFARLAHEGIDQATAVLQDLLEFTRPTTPAVQAVDVCDAVQRAVRLASGSLAERGVTLRDAHQPPSPVVCLTDPAQLQRAFMALLLDGTVALHAQAVQVAVVAQGTQARVEVTYGTPPTAPDRLRELFEPFTDPRVGHGLTLALARRLVENLGGRLSATAGVAEVTVSVALPFAVARTLPEMPHQGAMVHEGAHRPAS